jgi:hypothetical protein
MTLKDIGRVVATRKKQRPARKSDSIIRDVAPRLLTNIKGE